MGSAENNNDNAPTAFVLALAAGMATCLGAAIVFNRRLVKLASKRFLAGSLAIAAGVMLYVSMIDMFQESVESFSSHGYDEADAYLYGTLSLFGGMMIYKGLDFLVHILEGDFGDHNIDVYLYDLDKSTPDGGAAAGVQGKNNRRVSGGNVSSSIDAVNPSAQTGTSGKASSGAGKPLAQTTSETPRNHDVVVELGSGSDMRPSADLHTMNLRMAGKVQQPQQEQASKNEPNASGDLSSIEEAKCGGDRNTDTAAESTAIKQINEKKLVRMGLMTALAIGIHNFPEGLATFVGTLSDPGVGGALAVAIAIHNIPEGLCVAIPVYYATGSRWKAFGWAFLSGISEPIGAGIGWLILKDKMTEMVYGILFGITAGMMVIISIQELIPTAVRYDPTDKVTTNLIVVGMLVIALSLILFQY